MKIQRIDHVGVNVRDLAAAKAFFIDLGLEVLGEGGVSGLWVDRLVGLDDVKAAIAYLGTPDGQTSIELITFYSPSDDGAIQRPSVNTLGIRHIAFVVDDIDAVVARLIENGAETFGGIQQSEDNNRMCFVRGPEGMIIELSEQMN